MITTQTPILEKQKNCSPDELFIHFKIFNNIRTITRIYIQFSSVQFSFSVVSNSSWPMDCSTPGFPIHHQLQELAQTHIHWVSDTIKPSHLLSHCSPPDFNLSQHQGLFQWVSSLHPWPKYWSFNISPSSEYSGLISFRIGWLDLLALGTRLAQTSWNLLI